MKCTPMKLESRSELCRNKLERNIQKTTEPAYVTKECSWYSFAFTRQTPTPKIVPNVNVKDLKLPDDFISYNSGYSLEKWSKKRPRLKSSKTKSNFTENSDSQEDDDTCDIDTILNTLENTDDAIKEEVEPTEYEINSDIEELFRRSQEYEKSETMEERKERHRSSKRKLKRKLKKTIRYSFSKPASPLTEQIIRVDVTSSIPLDELRRLEANKDECRQKHQAGEYDNEEFDGKFRLDTEEQECIIRCSQLALTPKR